MTTTPDLSEILQDLAAGRIDAAEAARRIDALSARHSESADEVTSEPSNEDLAAGGEPVPGDPEPPPADQPDPNQPDPDQPDPDQPDPNAWASQTDRPQTPGQPFDPFPGRTLPGEEVPEEPPPAARKPVNTGGVSRISVRAVGRRVRIIGESTVATISADGPHVLRRNGSVLEVSSDGEMGSSLDGFSILRAPRNLDDIRALGLGKELLLKVNPAIVVDVEVTAGSLNTERVPHLGKVRVTAGGAKLLDVREINDALIQAGTATIKGAISSGRSRIRAESGSLTIHLADDSNVTVKGDAQLGKVSWTGGHTGAGDEVVMGNGSAKLDVEVVMGHAQVRVGSAQQTEAGV